MKLAVVPSCEGPVRSITRPRLSEVVTHTDAVVRQSRAGMVSVVTRLVPENARVNVVVYTAGLGAALPSGGTKVAIRCCASKVHFHLRIADWSALRFQTSVMLKAVSRIKWIVPPSGSVILVIGPQL